MYSLDNAYSEQELFDWENEFKNDLEQILLPSPVNSNLMVFISLTYDNGVLEQAVTKGDGTQVDKLLKIFVQSQFLSNCV